MQGVAVGNRLRAAIGDETIRELLTRHLTRSAGLQKPETTWWHLNDEHTAVGYDVIAETRWVDDQRTTLHTVCALADEWRELTGEDPPSRDGADLRAEGSVGEVKH